MLAAVVNTLFIKEYLETFIDYHLIFKRFKKHFMQNFCFAKQNSSEYINLNVRLPVSFIITFIFC